MTYTCYLENFNDVECHITQYTEPTKSTDVWLRDRQLDTFEKFDK